MARNNNRVSASSRSTQDYLPTTCQPVCLPSHRGDGESDVVVLDPLVVLIIIIVFALQSLIPASSSCQLPPCAAAGRQLVHPNLPTVSRLLQSRERSAVRSISGRSRVASAVCEQMAAAAECSHSAHCY